MNTVSSSFSKTDNTGAAKICLWFYLGALLISVAYILTTGTYNGDFLGQTVTLDLWEFSLGIVASVVPYFISYWLYLRFTRCTRSSKVRVGNALLGMAFFFFTIWFILLALKYDVGVLGKGIYDAPALLTPFIQITNRINPFYLGVFFIVGYQGSRKTIALGIALLITLGLLRAGLGVFMYVLLALCIRNHRSIQRNFFKTVPILLVILLLTPTLYSLRDELRGETNNANEFEFAVMETFAARLAGRLSSITNSSFVLQERDQFKTDVKRLDPWYYQRQVLAPLVGVSVLPEVVPEKLLFNFYGTDPFDEAYVSFMAGVTGNLAMAWFVHPLFALVNVFTMIFMIWLTYFFANKLDLPYRNEVCFMLLMYPLTSGNGLELSTIALSMVALMAIFMLLRFLFIKRHALYEKYPAPTSSGKS
jgi:hypothetical protein